MASGEGEYLDDLECGGTTSASEDEGNGDSVIGSNRGRRSFSRACSGALSYNGLVNCESDADSSESLSKLSDFAGERVELLIDKSSGGEECRDLVALLEKRNPSEQRKKPNLKKASRPPRPPKGPLLNASDLKLVKELSELAARKRARIERLKALRKMKESKRSTSSSSLTAMVITAIFFIIIIFQGVFSGHNVSKEFQGSPAPATGSEGLISIQLFNNAPTNEMNQPTSLSLNSLDQASSSSPQEEEGRDAR